MFYHKCCRFADLREGWQWSSFLRNFFISQKKRERTARPVGTRPKYFNN